jgi:hypothetical protein
MSGYWDRVTCSLHDLDYADGGECPECADTTQDQP